MIPDNVEKIIMTKEDYDRNVEQLLYDKINAEQEIERLNKKIEQYENPEDMTLMFMWCDEKAKDEIERLNNIINELEHHLYQEWLEWKDSDCESIYSRAGEDKAIYDYLQELKGSESNE